MIILASASKARRKLIKMCRKNIVVKKTSVDERIFANEDIYDYLQRVTYLKASTFINEHDTIISADTVVLYKDKIIGKPKNKEDAFNIISLLSGNYHYCFSGVAIVSDSRYEFFIDYALVHVRKITKNEIESYLNKGEYKYKAAGYAIQSAASDFVSVVKGDITTVIGLPMKILCKILFDKKH